MNSAFHQPVLAKEAADYLLTRKDGVYVDCTVGGGGHAESFLAKLSPEGLLIAIDADPEALEFAGGRLRHFSNVRFRQSFFDQLELVVYELDCYPVDGIFYDLGVSSFQIDEKRRGFSFQSHALLDMRFNPQQKLDAAQVVNLYSRETLEKIIREYGEERHWRAIAREIVRRRARKTLSYTSDLAEVVKQVVGHRFLNKSLARVFQAIRIEVNKELERLTKSLESAFNMLREGGRLVVISYHSLEDRIVKTFMRDKSKACICPPELPRCVCGKVQELKILTRRGIVPGEGEIQANPRARSARMRVGEKIVPFWSIGKHEKTASKKKEEKQAKERAA